MQIEDLVIEVLLFILFMWLSLNSCHSLSLSVSYVFLLSYHHFVLSHYSLRPFCLCLLASWINILWTYIINVLIVSNYIYNYLYLIIFEILLSLDIVYLYYSHRFYLFLSFFEDLPLSYPLYLDDSWDMIDRLKIKRRWLITEWSVLFTTNCPYLSILTCLYPHFIHSVSMSMQGGNSEEIMYAWRIWEW